MIRNRGAQLFFGLLIFFLIPFGVANYLFHHHINVTGKTVNKGILIQPMLEIYQLPLQQIPENINFNMNSWKPHWVLMYVYGKNCDAACQESIYYLRQIRLATGKYQDQIQRAFVSAGAPIDDKLKKEVNLHYNGTTLLVTSQTALTKFLNNPALAQETINQGQLFIVDPQGYVMMRYPTPINAEDVYKDLAKLLSINSRT